MSRRKPAAGTGQPFRAYSSSADERGNYSRRPPGAQEVRIFDGFNRTSHFDVGMVLQGPTDRIEFSRLAPAVRVVRAGEVIATFTQEEFVVHVLASIKEPTP